SGEHPEGSPSSTLGGCDEHRQKLASFDTPTDDGTAEEVLAYAEQSFDAPITWQEAPEGQAWAIGPESGTGALHIDVTRGGAAYLLTYSAPLHEAGPAIDIGVVCP